MLSNKTIATILENTNKILSKRECVSHIKNSIKSGGEVGHKVSDFLATCIENSLIDNDNIKCGFEYSKKNEKVDIRSMGDIWVKCNTSKYYTPINVKISFTKKGSPNIAALNRIINGLNNKNIDSYYLLIVNIDEDTAKILSVVLINILDYVEFIRYDAGPGQTMLDQKRFYSHIEEFKIKRPNKKLTPRLRDELVDILIETELDGLDRLIKNRMKRIDGHKSGRTKLGSGEINDDQDLMFVTER